MYTFCFRNIIERRKIDSSNRETVVKYNIYSCKGLAIDWLGRNLYWTDEEAGTISVVSLEDFSKRRTLIRDKKIKLYSIVLDPNAGYVRSQTYLMFTYLQREHEKRFNI